MNLPQDPLNSNVEEEVIEREEEEVIEEYKYSMIPIYLRLKYLRMRRWRVMLWCLKP